MSCVVSGKVYDSKWIPSLQFKQSISEVHKVSVQINYPSGMQYTNWREFTYPYFSMSGQVPLKPLDIWMPGQHSAMEWHILTHHDGWILWSFSQIQFVLVMFYNNKCTIMQKLHNVTTHCKAKITFNSECFYGGARIRLYTADINWHVGF